MFVWQSRDGDSFSAAFLMYDRALASADLGEYVQLVCGLAADQELLAFFHDNLRSMVQDFPLLAGRNYVREVEDLYQYILVAKR